MREINPWKLHFFLMPCMSSALNISGGTEINFFRRYLFAHIINPKSIFCRLNLLEIHDTIIMDDIYSLNVQIYLNCLLWRAATAFLFPDCFLTKIPDFFRFFRPLDTLLISFGDICKHSRYFKVAKIVATGRIQYIQ